MLKGIKTRLATTYTEPTVQNVRHLIANVQVQYCVVISDILYLNL